VGGMQRAGMPRFEGRARKELPRGLIYLFPGLALRDKAAACARAKIAD